MENESLFRQGDRVTAVMDIDDRIYCGMTGTVCSNIMDGPLIRIEWDTLTCGHSCGGRCENGHGWNVRPNLIELYCPNSDEEEISGFSALDFESFLFGTAQ